jgi:hypothetical protein
MPKALCMTGMVVAILVFVLFSLDLAFRIPFGRASAMMDTAFVLCAAGLGALSFLTFLEQD